jgi:hypothetical protein
MGSLVLVAIAAWQREIKLSLGDEHELRVGLRKILSFFFNRPLGLHHQTVQRNVERAGAEGAMAVRDHSLALTA